MFKRFLNTLFRKAGYEFRKIDRPLYRVLSHARHLGFVPTTVIDVGAAWGEWSRECAWVFPDARYLLIEPLVEYRDSLERVAAALPHAVHVPHVVSATPGTVTFHVHPDLTGSSLYKEGDDPHVNGALRTLSATTLDVLMREQVIEGPCLLKIDVQGAELDVLRGGEALLQKTEYVILETSLFASYDNVPLFHQVIAFMAARGFVPYDILGLLYRPLDGALCQADVCFVKEKGFFRAQREYRETTS